jgi:cytosine/adenosine deaminase-related metal-dependent hydrolase
MRWRIEAANGVVEVAGGYIVTPTGKADHHIVVSDGMLHPGLINAHDHLRLNHFGRLGRGPYGSAYDWARDVPRRHADIIASGRKVPRRAALLWGAWKNLLAGATTVVHHDVWELDFEQDFPLHVVRIAFADSLGMTPDLSPPPTDPFALHLAEGTDANAADEVREAAARGLLDSRLLAVHAVGADADGVARLRASGCVVIWCPTSNHFLFGRTAPDDLLAEGMDVLLGTDSLLTGFGDLLDELHAARGGALSDERLEKAVGELAAARLGLDPPSLSPGRRADLIVLRRPLLAARAADIALVMAQGELRVLDPALVPRSGVSGGQFLKRDGFVRWISETTSLPASGRAVEHHRA